MSDIFPGATALATDRSTIDSTVAADNTQFLIAFQRVQNESGILDPQSPVARFASAL
jgi:hypothetical protein